MALPSQISYCKVTGRLLLALGDTNADVDKLPDGPGLDGATITITPRRAIGDMFRDYLNGLSL
jgi:hypothetical protein